MEASFRWLDAPPRLPLTLAAVLEAGSFALPQHVRIGQPWIDSLDLVQTLLIVASQVLHCDISRL